MSKFNIPADFSILSIEKLDELNKGWDIPVNEVYGSLPDSKFGSGRKYNKLPKVNKSSFKKYFDACLQKGIVFNYTLNASNLSNREFTKKGQLELLNFIQFLHQNGVRRITVSLPSLIPLLEKHFPDISVIVSVIASVDSLKRAAFYCNYKNVKCIYVHEAVNRQTNLLKDIVKYCHNEGVEVGTIVNLFCLYDCPMRSSHYCYSADALPGSSYMAPDYYSFICTPMKFANPEIVLSTPIIRPEDLDFYINAGVDQFKLSGREKITNNPDIFRTVNAYNLRKWDGNLIDLFNCFAKNANSDVFTINNNERMSEFIKPILSAKIKCSPQNCHLCKHCESFSDLISINEKEKDCWNNEFNKHLGTHVSTQLKHRKCHLNYSRLK